VPVMITLGKEIIFLDIVEVFISRLEDFIVLTFIPRLTAP
jgi:hypothetical protein